MVTPPSSRGPSIDPTFRLETPEPKPALSRTPTSMSLPRNELLRKTLEARRAQDSPIQSSSRPVPLDTLPPRPAAPTLSTRPQQLETPAASPDPFDEFDLPADLVTPESPIQKRHPRVKDDTPPRGKTNQELSAEVQRLRQDLITERMRCELTKKDQQDVHDRLVKAKEEVERLQSLDLEMREVEAENRQLKDLLEKHQQNMDEIDDMNDQIDRLQAERDAVEEQKEVLEADFEDMKKAADAELANMEEALKEAVDLVHSFENERANIVKENNDLRSEKERLRNELRDCIARIAAIESQRLDGSPECPQQPYVDTSLDEHRPATSYDDSDYFSQPATPRADIDKDAQSLRSVTSARSKQFIELTRERSRSARRLSMRMSGASLRAASVVSAVHAPEVPHIPEEHVEVTPRTIANPLDRERWWKDTEHVKPLLRTRATTRTLRVDFSSDDGNLGSGTSAVRAGGIRTTPTTPAAENAPEKDFLFNPKENEEDFMRKAIGKLRGSIRRRHNELL
ncbi:hypothetical protein E8E12_005510 [Didymella heteroderae]|uniref:Uncharacterized protein n=1 Tax=Didymella heteroderae TaxID=1769908 RepID=A0A9P4WKK6_9PLEO|nr:hypothetical protein E8E12_005510 [Didymella heteroderae]